MYQSVLTTLHESIIVYGSDKSRYTDIVTSKGIRDVTAVTPLMCITFPNHFSCDWQHAHTQDVLYVFAAVQKQPALLFP